jgi:hypothetical protein
VVSTSVLESRSAGATNDHQQRALGLVEEFDRNLDGEQGFDGPRADAEPPRGCDSDTPPLNETDDVTDEIAVLQQLVGRRGQSREPGPRAAGAEWRQLGKSIPY